MPIDPYSPCPGGTGKKVKFCCSDLVSELDKVQHMLDGEQMVACLDYVRKLDEKYPGRACLQSIRVSLEDSVGDPAAAETTLAGFLKQHPDNAVALAEKSLHAGTAGDPLSGIGWLQQAIEACGPEMPVRVYDSIGALATVLLSTGHFVPARAHLQLQVGISQARDQRAVSTLLQIEGSPQIPLLLKDIMPLEEPPADAPWRGAFIKALEEAQKGHWKRANEAWSKLESPAADSKALWRNLATVRSYLGNYDKAVEALRKLAGLNPASDEAIDAEALAQLLSKDETQGQVDELTLAYAIGNAETVQEKLAGDRRFERLPLDTAAWPSEDEPPPRAAYLLLDRPTLASGKEIKLEEVPNQLGQMFLFGKQTDRDARLEVTLFAPERSALQKLLGEALGSELGKQTDDKVIGHIGQAEYALSWHWRLPDDTPEQLRLKLALDQRRQLVLERWPNLPQPLFGGRTPKQAAGESQYRTKLLAAIWLLEVSDPDTGAETYNELRRELKLPDLSEIDPAGMDMARVALGRLARVKIESLSDDQLKQAFNRAMVANFALALRRLAPEVLKREGIPAAEYKLAAYRYLVRAAADSDRALQLIDEARRLGDTHKQSSAQWDLMELSFRIARNEAPAIMQLIDHIQRQHGREPGVAQALVQLLMQTGLVGPDGRLAMGAPAAAQAASPLVVPGAAAEAGKLWTPESAQPAGEKKGSLWLPD